MKSPVVARSRYFHTTLAAALMWAGLFIPHHGAHAQMVTPVTVAKEDKFLDIKDVRVNGVQAWLAEDHSLPIITIDFAFRKAGSAYDPADKSGVAQMASNMLDEGAGPYDSQEFQKLLTDHSISLSFSSSRDYFSGSLQTLTRNADLAFTLLHLALSEPRFDQEPLERMRAANIARIRSSLSNPEWIAARITNHVAFESHPYARNAGGTISSLNEITADDLRAFTRRHLTRGNLVIGAAGDITQEEFAKRLNQVFGALPAQDTTPPLPEGEIKNGGTTTLYESDIPQTIIQIMQPGVDVNDPDHAAAQLMNHILGSSGFGSRLMSTLREDRGLTYGIYTSLNEMDAMDALSLSTSTRNESAQEVLDLIKAEWTKMRDTQVSDDELRAAQAYMIGSMPLSLSSIGNISGMLLSLQLHNRPIDYLDQRAEILRGVSAAEIKDVAGRVLRPDHLTVTLVGKPENVKPDRIIDTIPDVE